MAQTTIDDAINGLKDDDVNIKMDSLEYLMNVNDEIAIDPLIEATTDDNTQVRFKAAGILGNFGDVAFDKLTDKFENAEGKNKRFLAYALKEMGNSNAIPYFVDAIDDEDFGVRKMSVRALGELQAENELDVISKCLEDEDYGVCLAAIHALSDLATPEAIDLIKKARSTNDEKRFKSSCNKALKKAKKVADAKKEGKIISKVMPLSTIKGFEKTNPQKAIKEYEKYLEEGQDKDTPYKRLCILYRKSNDLENELHVIDSAIEVLSEKKPGKEKFFQKRREKLV
ncbi:HEAT repeat domain-containing protein [Methanobrevibacter woesei]|uniref:HEAT repeat domain-containing protein n=1 Tax=Methanobrevibacter woesei TaxID=190976 RepID=UPI0024B766F3|nr:HEAT repeat domain-containing protein [Methanobrevibacter woesei]